MITNTVGDIIMGVKTGHPHLDEVGDVGTLQNRVTHRDIARYVVVRVYPDPVTNERLTKDIQINESLDPGQIALNPDALCAIHSVHFPCAECAVLAHNNYAVPP